MFRVKISTLTGKKARPKSPLEEFKDDEEIEELGLTDKFERITELKEELDFEYLVKESSDLIDGVEEGRKVIGGKQRVS